jgi:hypothetical protein
MRTVLKKRWLRRVHPASPAAPSVRQPGAIFYPSARPTTGRSPGRRSEVICQATELLPAAGLEEPSAARDRPCAYRGDLGGRLVLASKSALLVHLGRARLVRDGPAPGTAARPTRLRALCGRLSSHRIRHPRQRMGIIAATAQWAGWVVAADWSHPRTRRSASTTSWPGLKDAGSTMALRRLQRSSQLIADSPPAKLSNDETPGHGIEREPTITLDLAVKCPERHNPAVACSGTHGKVR